MNVCILTNHSTPQISVMSKTAGTSASKARVTFGGTLLGKRIVKREPRKRRMTSVVKMPIRIPTSNPCPPRYGKTSPKRRFVRSRTGVLAMVLFLIASMPVRDLTNLRFGEVLPYLGGQGLLVGILIGILTTEVMRRFRGSRFTIRLPKS